ncbi:MAG: hypothetical protein SWO11_14780 [Thermodesulfobacteriota bacterium]|nr:hypothetical protein [Thermodesulfobacteriota bacterium]
MATGYLNYPHCGFLNHYDPRAEIEWGYCSFCKLYLQCSIWRFRIIASDYMPRIENGKWNYVLLDGRVIDRDKFEDLNNEILYL